MRIVEMGALIKEVRMNQLLQSVLTTKELRGAEALPAVAAQTAASYLPWSSDS